MTSVREAVDDARGKLMASGIETAALDARLLVQAAAGLRHEEIVANPGRLLDAAASRKLQRMLARRRVHEPVSRILGKREFYGRAFQITPAVLDPRPDTEVLIGEALRHMKPGARLLDLGTGSGAIIVTLLAECPTARGVATDISAAALAVAKSNAERWGLADRLQWIHCNWFEAVAGLFDLIVSNPPYIPLGDIPGLSPGVQGFDPATALDGGPDGLEAFRRIADGANPHLAAAGSILVEIGAGQERAVERIFADCGFGLATGKSDLAGHIRCLVFTRS
jgi:release factor glutamine methyltransferase